MINQFCKDFSPLGHNELTLLDLVIQICQIQVVISVDGGMSPSQCQAIILINEDLNTAISEQSYCQGCPVTAKDVQLLSRMSSYC